MNIYDVSREANVSAATVSRVINGSSKVSPATRKKVLDVIHKSGYIPNAFAQGLSHDTMRTVGILCVDPSDPNACGNFSMGIGYVQRELRGFDYDTVIYCVGYDMEDKASCLQTMCDRRVDSIVVLGSFFVEGDPEKNACIIKAAQQVPVFLVNGYIDAPNVYSFRCGDRKGAFQAVNQMAKSGAKDILFLHHNMTGSVRSKLEGYQEALHQNGLTVRQEYICSCSLDIQESAAEVERLAEAGLKFDGVIATEDSIAVGVLKYAQRHGIAVPDDLCVIGFGNTNLTESCTPELSSVDNSVEAACVAAVSMLIHKLKNHRIPSELTVSSAVVYRKTTR